MQNYIIRKSNSLKEKQDVRKLSIFKVPSIVTVILLLYFAACNERVHIVNP